MQISKRLLLVVVALNVVASMTTLAQNPTGPPGPGRNADSPPVICKTGGKPTDCNGISVGMPKLFDNRSLTLKMEALQKALQQQQATNSTVDLKSVMAALANTQGLTQSEVSTVLSILGKSTPSTGLTTDVKSGNVDSNGNPLPTTTDTQTSKNVASVTPAAPTFDSFATLPSGFNPTFGPSASDLLNDQVNLNYQIINLQMILERALSDRLYSDCNRPTSEVPRPNCTRLQTVLGFNVSIDPPRVANDAVAVVEVALTKGGSSAQLADGLDHDLSLVAVMPQEKTYNSASLSSSSHAYSGAAVVNAFQVSGGYRKRNQTFYVYRDTDTLAYERMTDSGDLVFGWMFRPVLGRRSVSPGLRQLFAVISLPRIDCDHEQIARPNAVCRMDLTATVRTYWKKFSRATQTSFEKHDANRASKFWYNLSAGLSRPQIFGRSSYVNAVTYHPLRVYSSADYEDELRPVVQTVTWHATGEKNVVVSVTGRNFFTNTQVQLGDTTYSEDNKNLVIKSDESLDLLTTADQLTAGPGSILGRYGLSVPIVQYDSPAGSTTIMDGFRIVDPQIGPSINGYRTLELSLVKRHGGPNQYLDDQSKLSGTFYNDYGLNPLQLPRSRNATGASSLLPPIVSVNGTAIRRPYEIYDVPAQGRVPAHVAISASFPDSLIAKGAALIKVSWPFYNPDQWTDALLFSDADDQFKVDRVSPKTILIRKEGGGGFDKVNGKPCWTFVAGDTSVQLATYDCPYVPKPHPAPVKGKPAPPPDAGPVIKNLRDITSVTVGDKETLPSRAVLLAPDSGVYHLTIPEFPDKKPDTAVKPIAMKQNDSAWIKITLPAGKSAKTVKANGVTLEWKALKADTTTPSNPKNPPPQTIEVEITRSLTAKAGSVDVSVFDASDASVARQTIAITCNGCRDDKGDK
jgi:hypothetical protein